jgi:non-heme chloroperoxidase
MEVAMQHRRLVIVPSVGHAINLEMAPLDAGYFGARFGGG